MVLYDTGNKQVKMPCLGLPGLEMGRVCMRNMMLKELN
jgi:hypothetical protein